MSKREQIETAFRNLKPSNGGEAIVEIAVDLFVNMHVDPSDPTVLSFMRAGRTKVIKELETLAWSKTDPRLQVKYLRCQTIDILARHGYCRNDDVSPEQPSAAAKRALESRDLKDLPQDGPSGRPKKMASSALAKLLAEYYLAITGEMPTVSVDAYSDNNKAYGPYIDLVDAIYKAFGIKANVEHFARLGCERLKEKISSR